MKEIKETKLVERTTVKFIADDGKEFMGENAEKDCVEYEKRLHMEEIEKRFVNLDRKEIAFPMLEWFDESASIYKYNFKSKNDFDCFMDFFNLFYNEDFFDNYVEEPALYPCTKIILVTGKYVDEYNDFKSELKNALKQIQED